MKTIQKGFTLVELLIVIGLLGAIALIVIAAINPLEQTNRARDTRFKADGSQLIAAIDRYFATKNEFPWVTANLPAGSTNETSIGYVSASYQGIGICGATCSADGTLITNLELKTEFRNRDFVTATTADKQLFVGKDSGASSSEYACYIPMSKTTREKSCTDGKVFTLSASGTRSAVATGTCASPATWLTGAPGASSGWYVCVPE